MENDLNISIQGFNSKHVAKEIGNLTLEVIKALDNKYALDITKLRQVIISCDFPAALAKIASEFNHQSSPTFTNSKQATAIAQLLIKSSGSSQPLEYALVLCVNFFSDIINSDGSVSLDNVAPVIHRIHHELVHVHEMNINSLDQSRLIDDFDDAFLITSKSAWSEYLANCMSSPSATDDNINIVLNTLEVTLNDVPNEIEDLINNYQAGLLPLDTMYNSVSKRIRLIANMYGYAQGYIHTLDIDMDSHFPTLLKLLSSSKLAEQLSNLGEAFTSIKVKFDLSGLDDFDDFGLAKNAIISIYDSFGLRIERNIEPGMGLYIHVC